MKRKTMITTALMTLGAISVLGQSLLAAPAQCPMGAKVSKAQCPMSTNAQTGQCGKARFGRAHFGEKLNLTAEQKSKVESIMKGSKAKAQALRNDKSLTPEQQKTRFMGLRKSTREQVSRILTAEQREKLTKARMGHQRGCERMKKACAALNLTDAQKTRLKSIKETLRPKIEAVRADKSLTPEQSKSKVREIIRSGKEQAKKVLTPEQIKKAEDMHAQYVREQKRSIKGN